MKVLITSGGTKIKIDQVRSITNMSQGTFGAQLAHETLLLGEEVIFLRAKRSNSPFTVNIDLNLSSDYETNMRKLLDAHGLWNFAKDKYTEHIYKTFDEYAALLEKILVEQKPDITVLAAAVSDYGVENVVDGKIRSNDALSIHLKPLPKLISQVKKWCPTTLLVGFKLLVGATQEELIAAARKSIEDNDCDIVVANDWLSIVQGNHVLHLVQKGKDYTMRLEKGVIDNPNHVASKICRTARWAKEFKE
jgi:phosphopantothenate-cysteine ligase